MWSWSWLDLLNRGLKRGFGFRLRNPYRHRERGQESGGLLAASPAVVLGAFEALAPRRIENFDCERRSAGLLRHAWVALLRGVQSASQGGDGNHAGVGGPHRHEKRLGDLVGRGAEKDLRSVGMALVDLETAEYGLDAELNSVMRLFQGDQRGDALKQSDHHGGRKKLQPQLAKLRILCVGTGGIQWLWEIGAVGSHVHLRPSAHGGRSQNKSRDRIAGGVGGGVGII